MTYTYAWDESRMMWLIYWDGYVIGGCEKMEDAQSWCDGMNAREGD